MLTESYPNQGTILTEPGLHEEWLASGNIRRWVPSLIVVCPCVLYGNAVRFDIKRRTF